MNPLKLEFFARPDLLISAVGAHRKWLEEKLAYPLEQCVLLEVESDLSQIALERVLGMSPRESSRMRRLNMMVVGADVPPGSIPIVEVSKARPGSPKGTRSLAQLLAKTSNGNSITCLKWTGCPVLLTLDSGQKPIAALRVCWNRGPGSSRDESANILVVPRQSIDLAVRMVEFVESAERSPRLITVGGYTQAVPSCSWDDMSIDPQVELLLRNDVDFFMDNRQWFMDAKLPHRRGYLLHGPPGNGKTSAIRCIMNAHRLSAYTLRFFDRYIDDSSLDETVDMALKNSPAILLFEDIDRAFPRNGESKCAISLQHLLNTLDGVATGEGLITIATANEPSLLDQAILRRPGRFDRVVHLPPPNQAMRVSYLAKRLPEASPADIEVLAENAGGMSYAQLREVHILAGQCAYNTKRSIQAEDIASGIDTLRQTMTLGTKHSKASGF